MISRLSSGSSLIIGNRAAVDEELFIQQLNEVASFLQPDFQVRFQSSPHPRLRLLF